MDLLIAEPLEAEVLQWLQARHDCVYAPRLTEDRKRFGLITGIVLALAVYFFMPSDLDHMLRGTAAIAVLMAAWWMSIGCNCSRSSST